MGIKGASLASCGPLGRLILGHASGAQPPSPDDTLTANHDIPGSPAVDGRVACTSLGTPIGNPHSRQSSRLALRGHHPSECNSLHRLSPICSSEISNVLMRAKLRDRKGAASPAALNPSSRTACCHDSADTKCSVKISADILCVWQSAKTKHASLQLFIGPPDIDSMHPLDVPQLWEFTRTVVQSSRLIVLQKR